MKMKNKGIFIVLVLLLAVVVSACSNTYSNPTGATNYNAPAVNNPSAAASNPPASTPTGPKITDPEYAGIAHLISGATLDASAQTATSGFNINRVANSDGTTTFTLTSTNPEYQDQTYTLQPGQQLYFIERSLGDDSSGEGNIGDDTAVVTDANGYLI